MNFTKKKKKNRWVHLLLVFLTHLLYSIQVIQSTMESMVYAVMLWYITMVHLKLDSFLIFCFSPNWESGPGSSWLMKKLCWLSSNISVTFCRGHWIKFRKKRGLDCNLRNWQHVAMLLLGAGQEPGCNSESPSLVPAFLFLQAKLPQKEWMKIEL